jgi:hypothetical protein
MCRGLRAGLFRCGECGLLVTSSENIPLDSTMMRKAIVKSSIGVARLPV